MNRKPVVMATVVLLAVGAGCLGLGSGNGSTPAPTDDPSTTPARTDATSGTPTAASGTGTYPRGWNETGVRNATVAIRSHYRSVLSGPSTTVAYSNRVLEPANETQNTTLDLRLDTQSRRLYAQIDGTSFQRDLFFADGELSRWDVTNGTLVGQSTARFSRVAQSVDFRVLKSQLLLYKLEHADTATRDGRTVLVYDVVGAQENAVSGLFGSATSASGTVAVTANGRVVDIRTTMTYTGGTVNYTYTQTNIGGTTVDAPSWLQNA